MNTGTVVFWWPWNNIDGKPLIGVVVSTDDSRDIGRHSASGIVQELGKPVQHAIVKSGGSDDYWFTLTPGTKTYADQLFIAPKIGGRDE